MLLHAVLCPGADVLDIVAASPVASGQEVHNTYGELGNDGLVAKYGFALRKNPFCHVTLDKEAVLGAVGGVLGGGERELRRRCRFLSKHR